MTVCFFCPWMATAIAIARDAARPLPSSMRAGLLTLFLIASPAQAQDGASLLLQTSGASADAALNGSYETDAAEPKTTTMVVVDMSGSMLQLLGSQRRYEIAKSMLVDVLPDVTNQSEVGLIAFGHRREDDCRDIELFSRPGASLPDLSSYVDGLLPINRAKTPLRDAVALAANQIPTQDQGTIVVISDGEDNCVVDVCNLVPHLQERGLPVFLLGIDLDSPAVDKLQCLTQGTGGFMIETRSAAELPRYTDFIFRLSRLRATNAALLARIGGLEILFNDQRMAQSELENQIAVLTRQLLNSDRADEVAALQSELQRLLDANAKKQSQLGERDARVLLLEQDNRQTSAEIAALTAEIDRLREMAEGLRLRLRDALSNQRDDAEVMALSEEVARLSLRAEALEQDRDAALSDSAELESMVEAQTSGNTTLEAERAELVIQLEALTLALADLEDENAGFLTQIQNLRVALEQNGRKMSELQDAAANLEDRDAQIEALLERLSALEATNASLSDRIQ